MIVGQKVVCVDDRFPDSIKALYWEFPVKDRVYVIRAVSMGYAPDTHADEIRVLLVGIKNPCANKPPFPERGFNAERFRTLEEMKISSKKEMEFSE